MTTERNPFNYCKYGHYEEFNQNLPQCINEQILDEQLRDTSDWFNFTQWFFAQPHEKQYQFVFEWFKTREYDLATMYTSMIKDPFDAALEKILAETTANE